MTHAPHPHGMRQIHLDFHTSREFSEVAVEFDPQAFSSMLAEAAVTSVNVFAKCHHGYSYYPSTTATTHPGLRRDLLGEQIHALHAKGIAAPIYLSVLWDDLAGELHPEWVVTNRQGRQATRTPLTSGSPLTNQRAWSTMDITSGYGDYVLAQLAELLDRYPVDGFWLDIVWAEPNYSPSAQKRMRENGIDSSDEDAVYAWSRRGLLAWMAKVRALVTERAPEATLFFNGVLDANGEDVVPLQSHLEVESLPTSGGIWGYMHYPVMSRFARGFGKSMVGMTGRFHRSWADFGGLKPLAQVTYESATIVAAGGAVCFGDQLDPDGRLDAAVYDTIGREYRRIRDLEPFLDGSAPVREAVIIGSSRLSAEGVRFEAVFTDGVDGAVQAMLETHAQFDVYRGVPDPTESWFGMLVIPGDVELTDADWRRLVEWVDRGATVVLEPDAARQALTTVFASYLPVTEVRESKTDHNYVIAGELARDDVDPEYPYAIYGSAAALVAHRDARVAGAIRPARFSRTWARFTSHAHAPVGPDVLGPAVAARGTVVVIAAPVMTLTKSMSYWVYPRLLRAAAEQSSHQWMIDSARGMQGELSVHRVAGSADLLLHVVPFHAKRAFSTVPRLDLPLVVADSEVVLRPGFAVSDVLMLPGLTPIPFSTAEHTITIRMPHVSGHAVVRVVSAR